MSKTITVTHTYSSDSGHAPSIQFIRDEGRANGQLSFHTHAGSYWHRLTTRSRLVEIRDTLNEILGDWVE